jgi:hypothetical protein
MRRKFENATAAFLNDFEVKKWLQGKTQGTKIVYTSALTSFVEFTKLTPRQLIDLAEEDRSKRVRERGDPENKVLMFFQWLTTEYVQKQRGRAKKRVKDERHLSRNLSANHDYLSCIIKLPTRILFTREISSSKQSVESSSRRNLHSFCR